MKSLAISRMWCRSSIRTLALCAGAIGLAAPSFALDVRDITYEARVLSQRDGKSSSNVGGYGWSNAFDGKTEGWTSYRTTAAGEQWLWHKLKSGYEPGKAIQLLAYSLYYPKDGGYGVGKLTEATCRQPATWTFEGSNDEETWDVLDTQTGVTDWTSGAYKNFPCVATKSYRSYRLHITAAVGANADSYYICQLRILAAVHDDETAFADARTWYWNGARGGDFGGAANWKNAKTGLAGAPSAGDTAVILPGEEVLLTNKTARLGELDLVGTLVMSNEATSCVNADAVSVCAGGVLTCADGSTNRAEISRVYVTSGSVCVKLQGTIDVTGKGYLAGLRETKIASGPGCGDSKRGGAHGGRGASDGWGPALAYDDAENPTEPGSSGYPGNNWDSATARRNGGGVVRIEATGCVTVDGVIAADGIDSNSHGGGGNVSCTAGAGGTVYIACETLVGSGSITANGGGGNDPRMPLFNLSNGNGVNTMQERPGGGGRIALHYNAAAQASADASALTISACYGDYSRNAADTGYATFTYGAESNDYWRTGAELGTVWVTDHTLVDQTLGKHLTGEIWGFGDAYTYAGDLAFDNATHVRFAGEGINVKIDGDLTLGAHARLEVGGLYATNRSAFADIYCGTTPVALEVTGDLTVGESGRFDIRAAATNGVDALGGVVTVGGALTIARNGAAYAWCDAVNGGAPQFTVGSLHVQTGGLLSAYMTGFGGGIYEETNIQYGKPDGKGGYYSSAAAWGPGAGWNLIELYRSAGGGHGGKGGYTFEGYDWAGLRSGGESYDDAFRPSQAGSGGGGGSYDNRGGMGGGVISVVAADAIVVDGEVNANGGESWCNEYRGGAGAGGTIFLTCRTFAGTGRLVAQGGRSHYNYATAIVACSGAGAGGRIAVWTGRNDWTPGIKAKRLVCNVEPQRDAYSRFTGTWDVSGGEPWLSQYTDKTGWEYPAKAYADDGTVWFCRVLDPLGFMLIVR